MKFKSIMELLPKAQRSHYLSIYGKSDGDILPDPAAPEKIFVQLPALELRLFELIVRRLGCYPFEWNKLVHAVSKQLTEAEIKVAMIGLRKKGVLFTAKKTWGEYSFFIAEDLYPAWHKLVFQKFYEKLSYADHSLFSEGLEMKFGGLLAALFHFVSAAAITGIPLTKQRGIHKRFLCELPQAGMLDSNVLLDVGLEPATSSVLPPAAALMLELAGRLGFVQQEEARLYVDTACLEAWLNRPAAELEWELAERIYLLLMPSDVLLQHSIFILRSLPPERQVTLSSLLDVLAEECGADEAEAICSQQFRAQLETWLRFMQEIGELAYARSGEDILIRRLPPACSSDNTSGIYIQPDFECIVPPDVSYAVRWKLNTIAELLQAEQAWIFKLKREKVEAQLQSGKAADELLRFLRSHAQYGVPENIADAMRQWERRALKLRFSLQSLCVFKTKRMRTCLPALVQPNFLANG